MELRGAAAAFSWSNSVSSSLHISPPQAFPACSSRLVRIRCTSDSQKADQMIVSVTGATGFIGKRLVQRLHADNHHVRVLTRSRSKAISIFPGKKIKKEIKESRIRVTSKVVDLINDLRNEVRPTVLISATAVGYYGTSETQVFDEKSPSGNDYLAEVCREWEANALKVNKDVRLALIRIGVVLGKDGGALGFHGFMWMT